MLTEGAVSPPQNISLVEQGATGTARLLTTILREKTSAVPAKTAVLAKVASAVVCVTATDRSESAFVESQYGDVAVRGTEGLPPRLEVVCESSWIPKVLSLRAGPLGIPKLWDDKGRVVVGALVRRQIVVRGMLLHPLLTVRLLHVLSVPAGA